MILLNTEPLLIIDMEKVELLRKLSAYVKHSEFIWKNSHWHFKAKKLEYVDELKNAIHDFYKYQDTSLLCRDIYSRRFGLKEILPDPSNKSYNSSYENLNAILDFCRKKLHIPDPQTRIKKTA